MTSTADAGDPIVTQTIHRALSRAQDYGHTIAGLVTLDLRPAASGLCTRCGHLLSVHFPRGQAPTIEGEPAREHCVPSPDRLSRMGGGGTLREIAVVARRDPRFVAHPLSLYTAHHGLDDDQLAQRLEMPAAALQRLRLYAVPPDAPALQRLARETGASSQRLAQVLTEAQGLVDEDGRERQRRERQRREHEARILEARRKRDSYQALYLRAQERLDALTTADTAATVTDSAAASDGG